MDRKDHAGVAERMAKKVDVTDWMTDGVTDVMSTHDMTDQSAAVTASIATTAVANDHFDCCNVRVKWCNGCCYYGNIICEHHTCFTIASGFAIFSIGGSRSSRSRSSSICVSLIQ